jgi:hypothetical protein
VLNLTRHIQALGWRSTTESHAGQDRFCRRRVTRPWSCVQGVGRTLARVRRVVLAIGLTGLVAAAPVTEPVEAQATTHQPAYDLPFIQVSNHAWLVSNTPAGCYLLSPRQKEGSGLAVGRSSHGELGLFLVGLALAMPPNMGEPVLIQIGGRSISESGKMIGSRLLFVPLGAADMASVLQELHDNGRVWLEVRRVWITHAGDSLPAALATYRAACTAPVAGSH